MILFEWDGEAMVPRKGFAKRCDEQFTVHEVYRMEVCEERSMVSHRHFFAAIHEAWMNLPEALGERFATPEHLRKYALIKTGFRDERSFACSSKAEALRLAAFLQPFDDYAVVVVHESTVIAYTAKSQSMKAMGKKDFQRSKDAVLGYCAELIGVRPEALESKAA